MPNRRVSDITPKRTRHQCRSGAMMSFPHAVHTTHSTHQRLGAHAVCVRACIGSPDTRKMSARGISRSQYPCHHAQTHATIAVDAASSRPALSVEASFSLRWVRFGNADSRRGSLRPMASLRRRNRRPLTEARAPAKARGRGLWCALGNKSSAAPEVRVGSEFRSGWVRGPGALRGLNVASCTGCSLPVSEL